MKSVSQWTGRAPHTRSVVSVCKSPVNKVVSVPFTSYIVAPGMWPAGWAVTSRSPMSTLSPKSIVRYLRRAVRRSLAADRARHPAAAEEDHRSVEQSVGPEESIGEALDPDPFGQGAADRRPPSRLVRVERRAVEEMVRRSQACEATCDHGHVIPAT